MALAEHAFAGICSCLNVYGQAIYYRNRTSGFNAESVAESCYDFQIGIIEGAVERGIHSQMNFSGRFSMKYVLCSEQKFQIILILGLHM